MSKSGELSLWRSLAVALGEGVAFSVGMKLTNSVARQIPSPHSRSLEGADHAEAPVAADGAPFDREMADAMRVTVDARIHEYGGTVERQIHDAAGELRRYVDEKIAQQIAALRAQMILVNREFAGAVATIVRDEVARQVEARAAALERALEDRILVLTEAASSRPRASSPTIEEALSAWEAWEEANSRLPSLPIDEPPSEAPQAPSEAVVPISASHRANGVRKRRA
jgi:hypothetical protein